MEEAQAGMETIPFYLKIYFEEQFTGKNL